MPVGPEWVRLGDALKARRIELARTVDANWRYRNRFVATHQLDSRTTADLEEARRGNYSDTTIRRTEQAYRWRQGSIAAVLAEGDPMPVPEDFSDSEALGGERLTTQRVRVSENLEHMMVAAADALADMSEEERARAEAEMIRVMKKTLRQMGAD
ncbi:hypothetical protein, partial [Nonomuraea antimicrobica]|uniref:hypothetical protein n=1 Tax=Nonomuraea antimicrobica TaxID=561173 RepID=UPI0031EA4107